MVRARTSVKVGCLAFLSIFTVANAFSPARQNFPRTLVRSSSSRLLPSASTFLRAGDISLLASTTDSDTVKDIPDEVDTSAIIRYVSAAVIQIGSIAGTFKVFDVSGLSAILPTPVVIFLFYALSLKSRVFNPLNNSRPDVADRGFGEWIRPSWTPPGIFFPIMWLLIIAPIRAYSTSLIFSLNGSILCDPTILSLMFHLTVGDIWNTINNTERRLGAAVVGVLCVLGSVIFAATQYYVVSSTAGKLLGATAIWISIASALIVDTRRLNKREDGTLVPLYPIVGEAKTQLFFEKK